jgi:hypothetical protein
LSFFTAFIIVGGFLDSTVGELELNTDEEMRIPWNFVYGMFLKSVKEEERW